MSRRRQPDELRERLFETGSSSLTTAEVVGLLVRGSRRTDRAIALAYAVLDRVRGPAGLLGSSRESLTALGVPPSGAATLLASVELARRIAREDVPERLDLSRPAAIARYLALRYQLPDQEVMGSLYLDGRHRLVGEVEHYRGTINRASVEPRAILKHALLIGAVGVVLFHTHPSGDPAPSAEDLAFTRRLLQAGEIMGVALLDHLILGTTSRWVSLRERGW